MQEQFIQFMDLIAPSYRIKIQNVLFLNTLRQNRGIKDILLAKKKLDKHYHLRLNKESSFLSSKNKTSVIQTLKRKMTFKPTAKNLVFDTG